MGFQRFLLWKGLTLALTAILALTATVTIAGYGGAIDQIATRFVERETRQSMVDDQSFRGVSSSQREKILSEMIKERREELGLDRPFIERMPSYVLDTLRLEFGTAWTMTSDTGSRKVIDMIWEKLPRTALLFTTGTVMSLGIGIPLGLRAASRPNKLLDKTVVPLALVSNALPMWWTGMVMIILFSFNLKIFPPGGFVSVPPPENSFAYALDILQHMALPLLTIILVSSGGLAYVIRNMALRAFSEDYIFAARARGISERRIVYRHAFRAASPAIATIAGFTLLSSLGGAIISEVVFNWPGMGLLYWTAITQQDLPVVVGLTYISILLYVLLVLVLEIIYGVLDPRIRVLPESR